MTLLAAIAIVLADWGTACAHMAYISYRQSAWPTHVVVQCEPRRLPFYDRKLPIFGDVWHLVAGFRYLPMGLLAWMAWGWEWEWYVGSAVVDSLGWYGLKVLHGKVEAWGWKPRWMKG